MINDYVQGWRKLLKFGGGAHKVIFYCKKLNFYVES